MAELLQAASAQVDGEQALIRWLASQIDDAQAAGDEQIVRLESDADLVKVVTVHKSKGLEYPLVFLPFACSFRAVAKARTAYVKPADANGVRSLVLQPSDDQIAAADLDRQREDLRLLYVALTRARHALWLGFAALKTGNGSECTAWRSAVGYLLCGPDKVAAGQLQAVLANTLQPNADSLLLRAAAPADIGLGRLQPRGQATPLRDLQVYAADFERRWTVGSFSGLVRDLAAPGATALGAAPLRDDEALAPTGDGDGDGDGGGGGGGGGGD